MQQSRGEAVEWFVVQEDSDAFVPNDAETVGGVRFVLRRQFAAFGPSATRWFVYQRAQGAAR